MKLIIRTSQEKETAIRIMDDAKKAYEIEFRIEGRNIYRLTAKQMLSIMCNGSVQPRYSMGVLEKPVTLKASALVRDRAARSGALTYTNLVGRITEFTASRNVPALSFLSLLIEEAQGREEPVVWVETADSVFYPPDFIANGIDVAALPVVWAPDVRSGVRAAEHLLRSGSFGLLVIDLPPHTIIDQGRLGKIARMADLNETAVVLVTGQEDGTSFTLGSIVSLRLAGSTVHQNDCAHRCTVSAVKDKQDMPGWSRTEVFHAPDGMY
jgi:recombination protein RecA